MKANWSLVWEKLQAELNYQKVAPTVTYQDIALSILLDVTSENQRVIDSVNFTEVFGLNLIRPVSDEVILSDSVVKYVIRDYFGDTIPLTDVLNTANQFLRDRFDEIHASDLESDALLNTSLIGEFLLNNLGSVTTKQVTTTPTKTDGVDLASDLESDALINTGLIGEFLLNNALSTSSRVTTTPTKTDGVDLASISDVLSAVTNKLFSDTANISDGTANTISKYLASGLSLDDFADINKSVNGVKGNIATMSDTISVSLIISRMLGSTTLNEITLN